MTELLLPPCIPTSSRAAPRLRACPPRAGARTNPGSGGSATRRHARAVRSTHTAQQMGRHRAHAVPRRTPGIGRAFSCSMATTTRPIRYANQHRSHQGMDERPGPRHPARPRRTPGCSWETTRRRGSAGRTRAVTWSSTGSLRWGATTARRMRCSRSNTSFRFWASTRRAPSIPRFSSVARAARGAAWAPTVGLTLVDAAEAVEAAEGLAVARPGAAALEAPGLAAAQEAPAAAAQEAPAAAAAAARAPAAAAQRAEARVAPPARPEPA